MHSVALTSSQRPTSRRFRRSRLWFLFAPLSLLSLMASACSSLADRPKPQPSGSSTTATDTPNARGNEGQHPGIKPKAQRPSTSTDPNTPQPSARSSTAANAPITGNEQPHDKPAATDPDLVPWGVAPSASSSRAVHKWAPTIAKNGVRWVRGFKGEPQVFRKFTNLDLALSGVLMMGVPGEKELNFPVSDLAAWEQYVARKVRECRGHVKYWEVWNEPPNFSKNDSPQDYAKLVIRAYDVAKAIDPSVQIGLAAQSVNLNFLAQALDAGARGHFDYVTLHPYEDLGLLRYGWEPLFMSIVPTVRKLLADKSPAQRKVPVIFTELGQPVNKDRSQDEQADLLVKAYVLSLAQGVKRIHWFEPLDGDSGPFGLIAAGNVPKASLVALNTLITHLGERPQYLGWTRLGPAYGFIFQGSEGPVMVAWTPPDTEYRMKAQGPLVMIRPGTGAQSQVRNHTLDNSPVLFRAGVTKAMVADAKANAGKPLSWGGDFSQAREVSYSASGLERGLHPNGAPSIIDIEGVPALDVTGQGSQHFTIDPTFNSYTPATLEVTAVFRSLSKTRAWFRLRYEAGSGYIVAGDAYEVPRDGQWHTHTWQLQDTQLVGKWGYHFDFDSNLRNESAYAIRSVTVRKVP